MKQEIFKFNNTYKSLPARFYQCIDPTAVKQPSLISFNQQLAQELGCDLEKLPNDQELAQIFSGNKLLVGSEPIAQAYAGHQFGGFVPQLGDGRAILLGEVVAPAGGHFDLQLKGSGQTRFSRRGDGRAALGPVIREYIISEAMFKLGVPTTRALAIVTTGEEVYREQALPGAILSRVASSHLRIGTFEYFSAQEDFEAVKVLADYAIKRHFPEVSVQANSYCGFLQGVITAQAELVSKWQQIGFVHGVMNTDNTSISGETIDYGPCAFIDVYDPATVFSSIDTHGRYAFGNQANIAQWNLARLAESLIPLLAPEPKEAIEIAKAELAKFPAIFLGHFQQGMGSKLGFTKTNDEDVTLIYELLNLMQQKRVDYTYGFRLLSSALENPENYNKLITLFDGSAEFSAWYQRWTDRVLEQGIAAPEICSRQQAMNPAFIPRNYLVEEAIAAAYQSADFSKMQKLMAILEAPYAEQPENAAYALPPAVANNSYRTFCGT